ncbi:hypothetical protein K505DRAFT_337093 [Melanomma pulvis-pyrius CBS 109.77]|uniref:EF-hand domain-containing protein n=1 Tax=Melanomma pulvis-pyrius CBS 109.77 TaxID=1314802 RepID=A0A6A6XED0_9PLEO|nr:hypothetical protein K505DRAFT_337093 [Melanomma pulvis-pyrius CBS 109.77]
MQFQLQFQILAAAMALAAPTLGQPLLTPGSPIPVATHRPIISRPEPYSNEKAQAQANSIEHLYNHGDEDDVATHRGHSHGPIGHALKMTQEQDGDADGDVDGDGEVGWRDLRELCHHDFASGGLTHPDGLVLMKMGGVKARDLGERKKDQTKGEEKDGGKE